MEVPEHGYKNNYDFGLCAAPCLQKCIEAMFERHSGKIL